VVHNLVNAVVSVVRVENVNINGMGQFKKAEMIMVVALAQ
jgi:hypothetical protein